MSSILSYVNLPAASNVTDSLLHYGNDLDLSFFEAPAVHLQTHKWAILFSLLVGSVVLPLTRYLLFHDRPPRGLKLVPGPRSTLPWLGRIHGIDANAPWKSMKKWSDEYGGLFRLTTAGGEMHIWLGDAEIAQELYCKRAAIYSSRPEVAAVPGSHSQGQYLPLLEHGDHWRRQRKFAHTVLNQAFQNQYYGYVTYEVKRFLFCLMQDPKDHFSQTDRFCGRISARLCYGSPNSAAAHCKNAAEFIPQISPSASGPITNIFPFLGKLPEFINSTKTPCRQRREREERMFRSLMRGVRQQVADGTAPVSYARTYFERVNAEANGDGRSFGFDDNEAAYAVGMLCTVAIFTIGGPLYCFFLAMTLHPEWQEKARAEVDAVVGHNRVVEVGDSPDLPILRACIKEVMRWRPPVPLGKLHP
jgi:cytochrome P450